MRTFLLCLLVLAPAALLADALSPQEARSILRQAQQAGREVGSFKEVKTEKTKYGLRTVTLYTLHPAGGPKSSRTETVTTFDGHPERTKTGVTITTSEGFYRLFKHHALLDAFKLDREKVLAGVRRQQLGDSDGELPAATAKPSDQEIGNDFQDRVLSVAVKLAAHMTISGERFEEGGLRRVRVVTSFDEEGQQQMKKLAEDQLAEMKKELPWALRLLVTPILAAKGGITSFLPVRTEDLIDEGQLRVIETTTYNASGKVIKKLQPGKAERIADLPPEFFAVPPDLEIVRAKSLGELLRLPRKIEQEEKNAEKAVPAAPTGS